MTNSLIFFISGHSRLTECKIQLQTIKLLQRYIHLMHCGTWIILLPILRKIINHSFCVVKNLHCNFHQYLCLPSFKWCFYAQNLFVTATSFLVMYGLHGPAWSCTVQYGNVCTVMFIHMSYIVQYDSVCSHNKLFDLCNYAQYVLVFPTVLICTVLIDCTIYLVKGDHLGVIWTWQNFLVPKSFWTEIFVWISKKFRVP